MGSIVKRIFEDTVVNVKDIPTIYRTLHQLEKPFRVLKIECKDDFFREDCAEKYIDFWKRYTTNGEIRRVSGADFMACGERGEFAPSLFSVKTLWVIEGAGSLKGQKTESFCSYIQTAHDDAFFVCIEKDGSLKQLEADGVISFPTLKPWERQQWLVKWIEGYAKKQGKAIASDAANRLAAAFSDDRHALTSELEKLCLYRLNESTITLSDVQAIGAIELQPTMWQLIDGLLKKDAPLVASCLQAADMNDIGLLRFVKNQLQKLIVAAQENAAVSFKSQERQIACIRKLGAHTVIGWINRLEREDVNIRAGKEETGSLLPLFLSFCG